MGKAALEISLALLCCGLNTAAGQSWSLHGQASGWFMGNPEHSTAAQFGLRYIPGLTFQAPVSSVLNTDLDLSLNGYSTILFAKDQRTEGESSVKFYRASLRVASDEFELRAGLQKISFGSAALFRSLMWFDKVDPRDPLQLTNGVYGLLGRYYFLNNANIWLWGLSGNDDPKGWELAPTSKRSVEFGGRVQTPLWTGEFGATYHHREADFSTLPAFPSAPNTTAVPENRFALDGKWDMGIGAWFEAVLIHDQTDIPGLTYQRQITLGADYTFDVGNGLSALVEYFRSDNPDAPFASADGVTFSALSVNYPLGVLDRLSGVVYRDWTDHEWYRMITWQRSYDNWMIYLLGFWNPEQIQLYRTQGGRSAFAGTGIQLMVVFNH